MDTIRCPACDEYNKGRASVDYRDPLIHVGRYRGSGDQTLIHFTLLEGIVTCRHDGYRLPLRLIDGIIDPTTPSLPDAPSAKLTAQIVSKYTGLVEDIEEAERCYFSQSYKASVVMCRRAMQLGLNNRRIPDAALSRMLQEAQQQTPPMMSAQTYSLAEAVKEYGDVGAHRRADIDAEEARLTMFTTVRVLNELFP